MLSPLPLFSMKEWGTHRHEGHHCPSGDGGVLEAKPICPHCLSGDSHRRGEHFVCRNCSRSFTPAGESEQRLRLVCNKCGSVHGAGWYRHAWNKERPSFIASSVDVRTGPLFHTIQHYVGMPDLDIPQFADFFIDIDRDTFKEAADAATRLVTWFEEHDVDHVLWFSGQKGFHLQVPWKVVGARPRPKLHEHVYKQLAKLIEQETGVLPDYRLYTRDRMLRVPNTMHASTGLYKVHIPTKHQIPDALTLALKPGGLPDITPRPNAYMQTLYEKAVTMRDEEETRHELRLVTPTNFKMHSHPPCVQKALEEGPPGKGTRHKLSLNLAAYFVATGSDPEEFIEWARNTPGGSDTPANVRVHEARSDLRWAQERRPNFSCQVMQELGLCDPNCIFHSAFGGTPFD